MQDKQMEFMFMAEGGKVDPVSGNEIPPGGTAEGVRDDVDAKLSEGEYVIPANVVRFLGVDKLEKMVTKAEETLAEMEANGRMGNPEPEEDDLPFSDEELQTTEGPELKMAEGGPVYTQRPSGGMFESVPYINAKGDRRVILMYNGMPINGMIPEGFFPDTPENRKALNPQSKTTLKPVSTGGDSDTDNNPNAAETQKINVEEWTTDDFENMMKQQSTTDMIAKSFGLAGPAGAILGAAMMQGNKMTLSRASEEIANRLQNPDIPQEEKDRLSQVYQNIQEKSEDSGGLFGGAFGDKGLLGGLIGDKGLLGGLFSSSRNKDQKGSIPNKPLSSASRMGYSSSSDSSGPSGPKSRAPTVSSRPASRPSSTPTTGVSTKSERSKGDYSRGGGLGTDVSQSVRDANAAAGGYTGGGRSGGFKKGGLVTRRNKK